MKHITSELLGTIMQRLNVLQVLQPFNFTLLQYLQNFKKETAIKEQVNLQKPVSLLWKCTMRQVSEMTGNLHTFTM